ncbi:MAG: Na/Pi cotransporter family protein [Bacteroidetes bacterium]|nr:Na/Pi cotransporter family protein [Bacteroidota bacterium]MDA1118967.1 Na/Pi cotransporter family protein [Bacteroidota bacterium]
MKFGFFEFLQLFGALGFFIYGMKIMSEGIQKVAGAKMRQILSAMTSNRVKGVLTGFTITSIVQSSSATTVLIVSFVNAGLLSLVEAIGVIMGANIGTTITAWLISIIGFKVKIDAFALPIIALGFPMLFFNRSKVKSWGEVLIGFALLFLGLAYLKSSVPDLRANPEILSFLSEYTNLGVLSILIFIGIGTLLTVIVQSSSAAMALTLVMANNGWISFDMAAAMVLGENIGTTITANLAATIGNIHAKRAALAHLMFNVFGVIWIIFMMPILLSTIDSYLQNSGGSSPYAKPEAIPIALSIFHTTFNVINTLILVNFVNFIAKAVTRLLPSRGDDEEYHLEYIGTGMMDTAELSLEEATKETARFGEITSKMSGFLKELIEVKKSKRQIKLLSKIRKYEEITDRVEEEITNYLMKVSQGRLSNETSIRVASLLSIANDLERIGDIIFQMSKDISRKIEDEIDFSEEQQKGILKMLDIIDEAFDIMKNNLKSNYRTVSMIEAVQKEAEINSQRNKLRKQHLKRLEDKSFNVKSGTVYKDLFYSCEKVGDHIINVTEAITGEKEKEVKEQLTHV